MEFVDTHCHIHFDDYGLDPELVLDTAKNQDVKRVLCVGCTLDDSEKGIIFAQRHAGVWASIGLHPHEASRYVRDEHALQKFRGLSDSPKVVAIGETGLDYYYNHSDSQDQIRLLRFQLDLATEKGLPVILHIRNAFDEFWPIFDAYSGLTGVVHSFSATRKELDEVVERGLYVGLNGIMTFTKDRMQLEAAQAVPLERMLLETDAPFLTPTPFRGIICEPKHVTTTAQFLAELRGDSLQAIAEVTSRNAEKLFKLDLHET